MRLDFTVREVHKMFWHIRYQRVFKANFQGCFNLFKKL